MDSKFYSWSKNGNKMIIHSDFKEFNKQTNCIGKGNQIANTIYGNCIRPYNETECNGNKYNKGHLFNYDLKFFHINYDIEEYIKSLNEKIILYELYIYKNGGKDVIGWLIQDLSGNVINMILAENRGNREKRLSALELVKNIIEE